MKIALTQMRSSEDPFENLLRVDSFVREAQKSGAAMLFLPENTFFRGPLNSEFRQTSQLSFAQDGSILENSDLSSCLLEFARSWSIAVCIGSALECSEDKHKPYNSMLVFGPHGKILSRYRKRHLFAFGGQDSVYDEEKYFLAGERASSFISDGWSFAQSICFDLRFPEDLRSMTRELGTQAILMPSAFTTETGKAHWHTLLRARAIENQSYVIAAAQWGSHLNSKRQELHCYGHSLIFDPWGESCLDLGPRGDVLGLYELNRSKVDSVRKRMRVF